MAILPMKRVMFATLSQKGDELLRTLQSLSVLHPKHVRDEATLGSLEDLRHGLNVQAQILKELESIDAPKYEGEVLREFSFAQVRALITKFGDLGDLIKSRERAIADLAPWGDFNPGEIEDLGKDGVDIRLWIADDSRYGKLESPEGVLAKSIVSVKGRTLFVTISRGGDFSIEGADEFPIPDERLSYLEADLERLEIELKSVLRIIGEAKAAEEKLTKQQESEEHEYDYSVAVLRAFDDGDVKAFVGWIPAEREEGVCESIKEFEVPVVMDARDPLPDEVPPVLTRNFSIARMMEPLLRLLGVPNYRGLDPALFFAPFMMLFFGVCLGDVGYGISMIVGALILKRIFRKKPYGKLVGNITILFGIACIIVGIVTGSAFGLSPGKEWTLIDVSFEGGDPMILFKISIALGIIHLTIAFILAALSEPSWQAKLAKVGSIAVLWSGALMVVGVPFWWVLLSAGLIIILVFFSDAKNPFKRLGIGLWGIYNHVSLIGDVMSYSRLFGLGIATAAIATVVNQLAGDARTAVGQPIVGWLVAIVVLVVGHLFNLALGIISAIVHPARLHAVEALPKFVKFTGVEYKPLVGD